MGRIRPVQIAMLVIALGAPTMAQARGGGLATYHAQPCSGDDCKADDPRANSDCKGWLCGVSSAKAMQRPVTAAEAEAAAKAQAAAAQAAPTPAPPSVEPPKPRAKPKRVVKAKVKQAGPKPIAAATPSPAPPPVAPAAR